MSDKPILFSGPMVRALLAGTKTQTRRAMNPQPELLSTGRYHLFSRSGGIVGLEEDEVGAAAVDYLRIAIGDRLYVRESLTIKSNDQDVRWLGYAADGEDVWPPTQWTRGTKGIPSIHAPRWTSRITLTVTDVRVERLSDISEEDAIAEGWPHRATAGKGAPLAEAYPIGWYLNLWDEINGAGAAAKAPWVAAYTFTVAMGNIDSIGAT